MGWLAGWLVGGVVGAPLSRVIGLCVADLLDGVDR